MIQQVITVGLIYKSQTLGCPCPTPLVISGNSSEKREVSEMSSKYLFADVLERTKSVLVGNYLTVKNILYTPQK